MLNKLVSPQRWRNGMPAANNSSRCSFRPFRFPRYRGPNLTNDRCDFDFWHFGLLEEHANQWAWLPAWGFLLVFYSNHSPKLHRFWAMGMGQTDGLLHNMMPTTMKLAGYNKSSLFFVWGWIHTSELTLHVSQLYWSVGFCWHTHGTTTPPLIINIHIQPLE